MKGLLIKDFYQMCKHCRAFLAIILLFAVLAAIEDSTLFIVLYPALFSGMIPATLLSYDERSGWGKYSGTLPCTKLQLVSGKYIIGLAVQVAVVAICALAQWVRFIRFGAPDGLSLSAILGALVLISSFSAGASLPFMYKCGVEKGRIMYYFVLGAGCAASFILSDFVESGRLLVVASGDIFAVCCVFGAAFYALSWWLSVVWYKKREM